jgi:tetratricopeptide (TPR) repeat protein
VGDTPRALACNTACVALAPDFHGAYVNRGLVYLRLGLLKHARNDLDRVIALVPERAETYLDRALVRQRMADHSGALADLTTALKRGIPATRVYFIRSRVRRLAGDKAGADADFKEGLRRKPTDELSWIARAIARMNRDPKGGLADLEEALKINPRSLTALRNKAHILAEIQNKQPEARKVLEQHLQLAPEDARAMAGLAVVLARMEDRPLSHRYIEEALKRDTSGLVRYQQACVYALTSRKVPSDADTAMVQLTVAIKERGFGADLLHRDPDLAPLQAREDFKKLVEAAQAWLRALRR